MGREHCSYGLKEHAGQLTLVPAAAAHMIPTHARNMHCDKEYLLAKAYWSVNVSLLVSQSCYVTKIYRWLRHLWMKRFGNCGMRHGLLSL